MQKTLKQFLPGECGTVVRVTAQGAIKRRLFDMGVTPGAYVVMRKTAPFGDPVEIRIRGYELSLRKSESEYIIMEQEETSCSHNNCCSKKGGMCYAGCSGRKS